MVALVVDLVASLADEASSLGCGFLSASEHMRLARLGSPRRRAQFLAGRLAMRRLLARTHGGDWAVDWPLEAASDSAPEICRSATLGRGAPVFLSISHSGPFVACAVSGAPVGVDIEAPDRERDLPALGEMLCDGGELAFLKRLGTAAQRDYFYRVWTLKEARFKRDGGWLGGDGLRAFRARELEPSWRAAAWTWSRHEFVLALVTESALAAPGWQLGAPEIDDPSGPLEPASPWLIEPEAAAARYPAPDPARGPRVEYPLVSGIPRGTHLVSR